MLFEEHVDLKPLTTFGIGGSARFFKVVSSLEELQTVLKYCSMQNIPFICLGKGSNTLFDDRGYNGLVILNKISFCKQEGSDFSVGSGYSFSLLGAQVSKKGFGGLEFASGIPASVGGAVYMNAGANGSDTFACLKNVTFVGENGDITIFTKDQIEHGYRFSAFQKIKGVIAAATFSLSTAEDARFKQIEILSYRKKTQPYGDKSAGCIFRNDVKASAGALIEKSGLKGLRRGGAEVSHMHANFIVNKKDATAEDVLSLAREVQAAVKESQGVELEMEVRVIPYEN